MTTMRRLWIIVALVLAVSCSAEAQTEGIDLRQFPEVALDVPATVIPPTPKPAETQTSETQTSETETPSVLVAADPVCRAPEDDTGVAIVPSDWSVGQGRQLTIVKQKNGAELHTPATIQVLEANSDGTFALRWETGQSELAGASAAEQQALASSGAGGFFGGLTIDYNVSASGEFMGMRNPDEVIAAIRTTYQDQFGGGGTEAEVAQVNQILDALVSQPGFLDTLAEEPVLWHSLFGNNLEIGLTTEFEGEFPNFMGGDPFVAAVELTADGWDANECAQISLVTRPDPESLAAALHSGFEALAGSDPADGEDLAFFSHFEMVETVEMVFDQESGWPREIVQTSETTIEDETRLESISIFDLGPLDSP